MKTCTRLLQSLALVLCLVALTAPAVQITFQVNMGVQRDLGLFDPANDFVYVAGTFNSWSPTASILTQSPTNADLYVGTYDAGAAGTWPNFKFIKNRLVGGVQWENDGVGDGGAKDRYFQVPATDSTLGVLYFNNITNVAVNYAPVTFQVNMSVQIAQGAFDPSSGTLLIAGNAINNWDDDNVPLPLTQSQTDTNIWTITLSVTNPVGSAVAFKYILNGTWETIPDRSFVMTNEARTLPVVYFNNVTNVVVPIPLTFQVNLGVQMALGNFDPANGGVVEVRGSFLTGAGGTWLGGFALTNDPANPVIYRGTIIDTNDSAGSTVLYQFVLNNGATWESTGNRNVVLASTNATTFPLVFFSNVSNLGPLTMGAIAGGETTLSWTAGLHVRLQTSADLNSWVEVPNTEGQNSANVSATPPAQFFRLVGP
jgi:hypothetical protein